MWRVTNQSGSHTCHATNNSRCFNDISTLHVLCGNDPSFPVASGYQGDVGGPAWTPDCTFITFSIHVDPSPVRWALISPARVVSHFNDLLLKGPGLLVCFIAQSLKIYTPVFLFMATADAMCPYLSCVAEKKGEQLFFFLLDCSLNKYIQLF